MWSDELDKKIKQTTEARHPAYDNRAWAKMEVLLDKHLPQKGRRRFILLLLLPLVLISTGVYFALQKQTASKITKETNTSSQSTPGNETLTQEADVTASSTTPGHKKAIDPAQPKTEIEIAPSSNKLNETGKQPASGQILLNNKKVNQRLLQQSETLYTLDRNEQADKTKEQKENFIEHTVPEQNTPVTAINNNKINSSLTPAITDTTTSAKAVAQEEKKPIISDETKKPIAETKPRQTKSSPGSKLSVSISAGPDLSSVGIDKPGKWKIQYGVGLSYVLSEKIHIRSGFFAGRKIYTADPSDYHYDYNPPPNLQKIDANCLVYEIPVNLIYNFSAAKKHNWFIAGGLSSYLMKKETYDYLYKTPLGQMQYYRHTYKNENSHLFSVVNLSGGFQYHFTDRFSLMAEPYVRIPINGIGQGKVKLNSAGVLFSSGFKPFLKKN